MGRKNEFPELKAIGLYAADTVGNGMNSPPIAHLSFESILRSGCRKLPVQCTF